VGDTALVIINWNSAWKHT